MSLTISPKPLSTEEPISPDDALISALPAEMKMYIFDYLDIKDVLQMSRSSRSFYNLAKDNLFWKQKAIQIGIPDKDVVDTTHSSIRKLFAEILAFAKRLPSSSSVSDVITIESLKNNLSKINKKKCSDFMTVWEKIIEQLKLSSTDLCITEETKAIENPDILEEMFSEWIEAKKNSINSLTYLSLANLNLSFLPTFIGKLGKLEGLDLNNNQLSSLPESFGKLSKLEWLYLNNNQLSSLPTHIGDLGKLKEVYLRNNEFSALPESIIGKLNSSCHIIHDMTNPRRSLKPVIATAVISFVAASILGLFRTGIIFKNNL